MPTATLIPSSDADRVGPLSRDPAVSLVGERLSIVRGEDAPAADVELRIDGEPVLLSLPEEDPKSSNALLDVNQIADADFSSGLDHWKLIARDPAKVRLGTNLAAMWTCEAGTTAYVNINQTDGKPAELAYVCPVDGEHVTVAGGVAYVGFIHAAVHRCKAELVLSAYDAEGSTLQRVPVAAADVDGGQKLQGYSRTVATLRLSEETASVRMALRITPTEPDCYLFFLRPFLGMSRRGAGPAYAPARYDPEVTAALRRLGGRAVVRDLPVPRALLDGRPHQLALIDRRSGRHLKGSPIVHHAPPAGSGAIEKIDGTTAVGWVRPAHEGAAPVRLFVDGVEAVAGVADEIRQDGSLGFHLPLPPGFCQGGPALLSLHLGAHPKPVAELAEVVPHCSTSWHALQSFGPKPLPGRLSPAAERRYRSLTAWTEAAAGGWSGDPAWLATASAQLALVHRVLIDGYETRRRTPAFALPDEATPTVSIVVPVHGKRALTYNCLAAIAFAYTAVPFEVIVVDDGSPDDTATLAEVVANLRLVRNATAQGFVGACTRGAEEARGRYVLFLNNDTEPVAHWLDELMFAFEHFDGVGLAGAKLIYPDGRLQEAGGIVWSSGNPWNYGRAGNAFDPRYNYTRQVDYVSGAALMVDRAVWDAVGGFTKDYAPAYFEDTDLAFKVRAAGHKTLVVPKAEVFHFEGMSNGTLTSGEGLKRFQEINRPKFKRAWAAAYRGNGEEGRDVERHKDRGVHFRGLVVDLDTPQPDRDAGSYAAIQEMRLMQANGCKLTFLPLNFAYLGAATEHLHRLGIEVIYAPFYDTLAEFLTERAADLDFVYVTRYLAARQIVPTVRQLAPHAKIIFCNADLHFLRQIRAAIVSRSPDDIAAATEMREAELAVMRDTDLTLSYNATEHAVIQSHNMDATEVALCPWVVDPVDRVPPFEARRDIAFLGGFGHPPNREAMRFFVDKVMPLIRARVPGAKLRIYGSGTTEEDVAALAGEDVLVAGFVEDVADVYTTCRVFIAPLLSGAGLKGKLVEALAYGVPSVVSPIALEGTGARPGLDLDVAETPGEYAEAIARLYADASVWSAMSASARQRASALYSFERGRRLMREALEKVGLYAPDRVDTLVSNRARG